MIIFGIDVSMKTSSVAVAENTDGVLTVLKSSVSDGAVQHSANLLPMIDAALKSCGLDISAVDSFAVTDGPGSFTGIRVGVATIKGLAYGQGDCCAGISALDALCLSVAGKADAQRFIIAPLIDARRNQAYNALYLYEDGVQKKITPDRLILIPDLLAELNEYDVPVFFCGDVVTGNHIPFGNIAEAACRIAAESPLANPSVLVPRYLIKTQAERELESRT